jgi:hypothetical protein
VVVVLWGMLPLVLISLGSSKLYHYAYPFLPPLTLAAGYLVSLVLMLAPVQIRKGMEWAEDRMALLTPFWPRLAARPVVARTIAALTGLVLVVAAVTAVTGGVRINLAPTLAFRNSGILRPLLAATALAILGRRSASTALPIVAVVCAAVLPLAGYAEDLSRLRVVRHPMRDASACVARVQAENPALPRGMFVDTDKGIWHPITYYFRRIHPWNRQERPSPESLERTLEDPQSLRPSLVEDERYRTYRSGPDALHFSTPTSPPMIGLNGYALLLPGPYSVCSPEAALLAER